MCKWVVLQLGGKAPIIITSDRRAELMKDPDTTHGCPTTQVPLILVSDKQVAL